MVADKPIVAIQGLNPLVGQNIVALLRAEQLRAVRCPIMKSLLNEQLAYFETAVATDEAVTVDPAILHVLHIADEVRIFYQDPPAGYATEAPVSVGQSDFDLTDFRARFSRGLSSTVPLVWRDVQERQHWWALSDERFAPYHYYDKRAQDVVMTVGGHQGYNLVNENTNRLVIVDFDARQVMNHTVIAGLLLLSDVPEAFIDNFLRLIDPATQNDAMQSLLAALLDAEERGTLPPGRRDFVAEIFHRTGSLSLFSLTAAYAKVLRKFRSGESFTPRERPNVDWILNPDQFALVRKMYREGRIIVFQANLFDRSSLGEVATYLRVHEARVSSLYLSNAFDIPDHYADKRDCFAGLASTLEFLPFDESGRVLWTYLLRENKQFDLLGASLIERNDPLLPHDPLDKYVYLEMPVVTTREWLLPIPLQHPLVPQDADEAARKVAEGKYYFYRLIQFVRQRGIGHDGKLWIAPHPTLHEDPLLTAGLQPAIAVDELRRRMSLAEGEVLRPYLAALLATSAGSLLPILEVLYQTHLARSLAEPSGLHDLKDHYDEYRIALFEVGETHEGLQPLARHIIRGDLIQARALLMGAMATFAAEPHLLGETLHRAHQIFTATERGRLGQAMAELALALGSHPLVSAVAPLRLDSTGLTSEGDFDLRFARLRDRRQLTT